MPPVRPHSRRRRFIEQDTHSLTPRLRPSLVHIRVWRKRKRVHLSTVRVRREGDQIRPCPHSLGVEEIGPNRIFAPPYGRERGGGREIRGVRKGREGVCNCDTGRRVNSFPSQKAKFPLHPRETGWVKSIRLILLWTSWISRSDVDSPFDIVNLGDK